MKPTLTLLIPCYNEAKRLPSSLLQLKAWTETNSSIPVKFIIVDDGSTDETKALAQDFPMDIQVISLTQNSGKGGAIAAGIKQVETDQVLIMDLDLSTSLICINHFYEEMTQTDVDLVVANRFHSQSQVTSSLKRRLSSKVFYTIVHSIVNFKTQDTQCGFKLFKTKVAIDLFSNLHFLGFSFDLEILLKAEPKYKIKQMPVQWVQKDGSRVSIIRDGMQMILDLLKLRFRK